MKKRKSSVLRKVKHQVQNENRSSFSGKVKSSSIVARLIKRLKENPLEVLVISNRLYNLIKTIHQLCEHFNIL